MNKKIITLSGGCLLAVVAVIAFAAVHAFKSSRLLLPNGQQPMSKMVAVANKPQKKPEKVVAVKDTAAVNDTVYGLVRDTEGQPLAGVVVSDGYTCVKTGRDGRYEFKVNDAARFVFYTVPDYCEVPVHSASDRTAYFYRQLSKSRRQYNFTLRRLPEGKERQYRLIVFGDPQVTNAYSPYYIDATDNPVKKSDVERFTAETMTDVKRTIASFPQGTAVYGISMGDDVQYYGGYNASLERQLRRAIGSSTARIFSIIGNHDQDGKVAYERQWEASWGPTDYSFDRGDEHYVCFNNVHFRKGSYYSPGELTKTQMEWLRQDLNLADKNKKVVFCYHIPFTFGNNPYRGASPLGIESELGHFTSSRLDDILKMASEFKGGYELFCGHTHFALNHEIEYRGQHLMEHCHAAACGNIWQSNINICGTPNGYYVYTMDSTSIADSRYKGTFWEADRQMSLFRADTDFNGESYSADWNLPRGRGVIVANVFNTDSRWKVYAVEDGVEREMTRISHKGQDAFATGYHHKYSRSVSYHFVSKQNGYLIMNHLYYYEPKRADAEITVKAVDPYGHTFTASSRDVVTEPYFNYAHYYR